MSLLCRTVIRVAMGKQFLSKQSRKFSSPSYISWAGNLKLWAHHFLSLSFHQPTPLHSLFSLNCSMEANTWPLRALPSIGTWYRKLLVMIWITVSPLQAMNYLSPLLLETGSLMTLNSVRSGDQLKKHTQNSSLRFYSSGTTLRPNSVSAEQNH